MASRHRLNATRQSGCIRIPLIINGPGFKGNKCPRELTSLIDLPPTIMTSAGITPPKSMRGNALQRLLAGQTVDWPQEVFLQISESQCGRAIRTRRWKYSVRAPEKSGSDPSSDVYVEDFLYDLEADPHERNNLIADQAFRDIRKDLGPGSGRCGQTTISVRRASPPATGAP